MNSPDYSLADLLEWYWQARPGEYPTLQSICKNIVYPHLGIKPSSLDRQLKMMPAHVLYGLLAPDQARWCTKIERALPPGSTYQKVYCRYIKRVITLGETKGLLHPEQYLITPAWRTVLEEVEAITAVEPPAKRAASRSAFKKLARWASSTDTTPSAIPLLKEGLRPMETFLRWFPSDRDGDFYRARRVWNNLVAVKPHLGLAVWAPMMAPIRSVVVEANWPPPISKALEMFIASEGFGQWRSSTRRGYVQCIGRYLGALSELDVPVDLLVGDQEPVDAMQLLFQGIPATRTISDPHTLVESLNDGSYQRELLTDMRAVVGAFDGRASEPNPFLVAAVGRLVDDGKITTAKNLLVKAIAINHGLLGLTERHTAWLGRRIAMVSQIRKKNPSKYAHKKKLIFRSPRLWEELVRSRSRLRQHTQALEEAWRQSGGGPRNRQRLRWAVALRNEVLFGLMLCYPLRVSNLVGMKLGLHYDPQEHRITFDPEETKNSKEIDYELPEGGSLGDLRFLVAQYLDEARPILLGRRQSSYFFLPDPRGGLQLRAKAVNAILTEISRTFLRDVLPAGLATLNPHLMRHIAASYHLAIGNNLNLAAQILNDSPTTVTLAYADVLAHKKEATKRFLSSFEVDKRPPNHVKPAKSASPRSSSDRGLRHEGRKP